MSVSELSTRERELISGTEISTDPTDFEPQQTCPNRVYVNGVRIPVTDVDVHIRKEGPLAINRYAEVNFASPWDDQDYLSLFDTLKNESNQEEFDLLRIETRNNALEEDNESLVTNPELREAISNDTDPYNTLFHGFVTGVGGSTYDNQKVHQCRAQGFEHLLESIPASESYNPPYDSTKPLNDLYETLNEKLPSDISLTKGYDGNGFNTEGLTFGSIGGDDINFASDKTFTANKHTVADVARWYQEKGSQPLWFQPTEKGIAVVTIPQVTNRSTHHTAHYLDGNTQIINNNALSELKPINTVILNSDRGATAEAFGGFEANVPDDTFFQVKARHNVLYQRAGETELSDTIKKSDSSSAEDAEREARQKLKERIDGATSGSMQVIHNRFIQPFDTIEARPTTNSVTDENINSLTYEVSRCHYKAHHNNNTIPHIDIQCGLKTDIEEDIDIIRTNEKDA